MYTEHTPIYDRTKRQIVEDLTTISPYVSWAIFPLALVIEAVDLGDLPWFVVSADESDALWIANLVRQKEEEGFHGVEATVNEVACHQGYTVKLGSKEDRKNVPMNR